jgi:hypothetical protein
MVKRDDGGDDMSATNTSGSSGGIGFAGALTIVFITLKLLGKVDWSWWWVLSPLWISVILFLAVLSVCLVMMMLSRR